MDATLAITFPTTVAVFTDFTAVTLSNVTVTATVLNGQKTYTLEASTFRKMLIPTVITFVRAPGLEAEAFCLMSSHYNDVTGELELTRYYRVDNNGTTHCLVVFND